MKKTKYEVYKGNRLSAVYVTEKHNAEVMLQNIRKQHETFDEFGNPRYFRIVQVIEGKSQIIYTPKMRKFWGEDLVV
jgi:hypothetical protein